MRKLLPTNGEIFLFKPSNKMKKDAIMELIGLKKDLALAANEIKKELRLANIGGDVMMQ